MNNRQRHVIGCLVIVAFGIGFLLAGSGLGSSIGWDLAREVSNESTILGGQRVGPAWGVIPVLLLLGVGGIVGGLLGMRLPVAPDGTPEAPGSPEELPEWDPRD